MGSTLAESLKSLREARGISQRELAGMLFVGRSTVARWEAGTRTPDATLIPRIAACLGVDSSALLDAAHTGESPNVIVVDDERLVLTGTIAVLEEALTGASIFGFARPSEALEFSRLNPVALALLDVEMGRVSGLDLCEALLAVTPRTNVVFLTAFREYSLEAWSTGACGFLLKPVTVDAIREQVTRLRFPVPGLTASPAATDRSSTATAAGAPS